VYPASGSVDVPTDTRIVILFNKPVDTGPLNHSTVIVEAWGVPLGAGDYSIASFPTENYAIITFIGAFSPLPDGAEMSLALTNGIRDGASTPLNNPGSYTFTAGTNVDVTAPTPVLAPDSRTPAPGAVNQPLTGLTISIQFDEANALAASTINDSTIYLAEDATGVKVFCAIAYNEITETVTLTPVAALKAGTLYEVTVTTDIQDLSGNYLAAGTSWTFTTVDDTVPSVIESGPEVFAVTDTEAQINWITDEPTNYELSYGRGDDVSDGTSADVANYMVSRAVVLSGLTPGKRYYAQLTAMEDRAGNLFGLLPYPATPLEFNTITDETAVAVHDGANREYSFYSLTDNVNNGFFGFWYSHTGAQQHLYGQLFDNTAAEQWDAGGGEPLPLFTGATFTYGSSIEDGLGGAVLVVTGTGGIRAKRLNADGSFFDWGAGTTTAADAGLSIDATNTAAYAVPVYSGIFTKIRTGLPDVEMTSTGLLNWFFDDDVDLSGLADNSDFIITWNGSGYDSTLVDNNTATQDFNYILGQSSPILVAGDTYYIGDASVFDTFTATNHDMNTGADYTCAGQYVYSQNENSTVPYAPTLPSGWHDWRC
jgi:hypothetical protein